MSRSIKYITTTKLFKLSADSSTFVNPAGKFYTFIHQPKGRFYENLDGGIIAKNSVKN
jgi:hypothetical protein